MRFLQNLLTNDFTNMTPGRCRYSVMCYPDGGSVDDVLVCKFADDEYLVVVNASNTDKDFAWMQEHAAGYDVKLKNDSANWAQLALQGPKAEAILAPLCDGALPAKYYTFVPELTVCGIKALVSRTGYTGEDGFELYCAAGDGMKLHAALLKAEADGVRPLPCALGARDTLRFEASMPLYGHELTSEITPRECGWSLPSSSINRVSSVWMRSRRSPPACASASSSSTAASRASIWTLRLNGKVVGHTTSGSPAPTLGGNYAMAIVEKDAAQAGTLDIMVRGRALKAEIVPLPFYKRSK